MINGLLLSFIGAIVSTIVICIIGMLVCVSIKNRKGIAITIFIINFVWMTFFLYLSCIELTIISVIRWMWPILFINALICYTMDYGYELISSLILTIISVFMCLSTFFAPVQKMLYVDKELNFDVKYIDESEIHEKIVEKNLINISFSTNGMVRQVAENKIIVYHINLLDVPKPDYIPGYLISDIDGNNLTFIKKMIYFDTSFSNNQDALRTVRRKYPTTIIGSHQFDIDDNYNPYEIFEYRENFYTSDGKDYGLIILNLMDGTCEKYPVFEGNIPSWVDFETIILR